jgi:hypothetical protein
MGVTCLLETLVINDELWVKSWRLLMVYKHALNGDDSKWSKKYRKHKLDCFAIVTLVVLQKSFLICQVKFRHSHISKHNFWRNVGWWYTVYRSFETREDVWWYNLLSFGASIRFRLMASTCGACQSHSDKPHWLGLLWTSDQPNAVTYTWQHTAVTRNRHPCPLWDLNPQSQQACGRRPTPLDSTATGIGNGYSTLPGLTQSTIH